MEKNIQLMRGMMFAALFAALTAAVSPIKIPLGFTPVPITLQTLMVLLSGAVLGARYGALSQALYLIVGALGLPVFAGGSSGIGSLLGPSGGYLFSYPIAAFAIGWMTEKKMSKNAQYTSAIIVFLLILTAYADLIFGMGIMKSGGKSLIDVMSLQQRLIWVIGSAVIVGVLFYLTVLLRKSNKVALNVVFAMFAGTVIIYFFGAIQGKFVTGLPWGAVFVGWVLPFIIGDTVKLMLAAFLAKSIDIKRYLK